MSCYFHGLSGLELAKQQQDEQHYQNNAEKAHSGVAHAIAVAAEPAAEATQQENNQDDDEYQSKRHGTLPNGRAANDHPPSSHAEQSITPHLVPSEEPGKAASLTSRSRGTELYPGLAELRATANLLKQINLIWAVQSSLQKYFCFRTPQITSRTLR